MTEIISMDGIQAQRLGRQAIALPLSYLSGKEKHFKFSDFIAQQYHLINLVTMQ